MNTQLRKSDWLDDWYVVDGAPFAQPEGTAAEWKEVIALMREGKNGRPGRRVGVRMRPDGSAELRSPRNSVDEDDFALVSDVASWISSAELTLATPNT